jgi:hypothetical protein
MRKIELAYMAGFMDGEGSISLRLQQGKYLRIEVAVAQNTVDVLWMFVRQFKGNIYQSSRCYQWKCYGAGAVSFLKSMQPFLIVKRLDAEEAIAAWERRDDLTFVTDVIQRKRMRHERIQQHHDAAQRAKE